MEKSKKTFLGRADWFFTRYGHFVDLIVAGWSAFAAVFIMVAFVGEGLLKTLLAIGLFIVNILGAIGCIYSAYKRERRVVMAYMQLVREDTQKQYEKT